MPRSAEKPVRTDLVAFFGALSLFFATLEYLFPKPIPFFRLGLSNLPLLISLGFFSFREQLLLLLLKVVGTGIVNGTLASHVFLFSSGATLASFVVMYGLYQVLPRRFISLTGISLAGALASNAVQIALAMGIVYGPASGVVAPWYFGLGTFTGLAMGWGASVFQRHSKWLERLRGQA
jgi:heptaprenyl diphosphate synthase